jgi:DNA replication and repair protein RecF
MQLLKLEIKNFRNIESAVFEFKSIRNFFLGENGQGKTNLLEAIGLLSQLKSFRVGKLVPLVKEGAPEATVRMTIEHEKRKETTLGVSINNAGKRAAILDGESVKSAEELLGLFPVAALTLADRGLLYGGQTVRREEFDHLISQIDVGYFRALEDYSKASKARNALLALLNKNNAPHEEEFDAFEAMMAVAAKRLVKSRVRALELLKPIFKETFAKFCPAEESPDIIYEPNSSAEELPELWRNLRHTKDAALGYASHGPHRDHYNITFGGEAAELYASEGQKFSIVLALKLSGVKLLQEKIGVAPILIADDLLLELDAGRQEKFWESVGDLQVFASGTNKPYL